MVKEKIIARIFRDGVFERQVEKKQIVYKREDGVEEVNYMGSKRMVIRDHGIPFFNVRIHTVNKPIIKEQKEKEKL